MSKRILLIGNTGQAGWELQRCLLPLGETLALDYPELNLVETDQVRERVRQFRPDVIVNAAGYTDVDRAEREPELAFAINGTAPGILAEEAKKLGAVLVHYSTDYVFDGTKRDEPYTEDDEPSPISVYAESKVAGDRAVEAVGGAYLILRTCWMYSTRRRCFLTKVLRWARQQKELRVVADQVASPTWSRILAQITAQILTSGDDDLSAWIRERKGVYNLAGNGGATRYQWAKAILAHDPCKEEQVVEDVLPAKMSDFSAPASRPAYSVLNCDKIQAVFDVHLPDWETCLALAMAQ
jgi:dTDP-4-dehydrorhamnose reductase